jgi:RHS repeat-associated protein
VREYIWLPETEIAPTMNARAPVDRPLAVVNAVNTAAPATWWVSVDHLNRPVKMTTSTKASVWDAVWLPWGGVHAITGTATLNARFPGQWFQLETGLHYNWHRSYDPTIGRYAQPDPLGFVDGPSVYGYASLDPLAAVDDTGWTSSRAGGFSPSPLSQLRINQYYQLRNEIRRYEPGRSEITPRDYVPTARDLERLASELARLQRTGLPIGGIYALRDSTGNVCYVGRTNNLDRRRREQFRGNPGLEFDVLYTTSSRDQQRALEQEMYNRFVQDGPLLNKILPLSPSNHNAPRYYESVRGLNY